ncbi:MAG: hypothetical protein WDM77_17995 [Steroidobacteraceae bacterium]
MATPVKISLAVKLGLLIFAMVLMGSAVAVTLQAYLKNPLYALLLTAGVAVVPALLAARRGVTTGAPGAACHADQRGLLRRRGFQRLAGRQPA